ncbi:Protease inhibitor precursor [compost metagenome]
MNSTLKISLTMLALSAVITSSAAAAGSAAIAPSSAANEIIPINSPAQSSTIAIEINGTRLAIDGYKLLNGAEPMLPLRAVAEQLGYTVKWNQTDRSAKVSKDSMIAVVKNGEDKYLMDELSTSLGTAPELTNGNLHVPASFVGEILSGAVSVNDNTVSITMQEQKPEQQQSVQSTGVITAINENDKYASVQIQGIGPICGSA